MDLRDGLRSAIRSWFVYRDQAVWCLVSGVEDSVLSEMELSGIQSLVTKMNQARTMAYDFATQIDTKHVDAVLRAELDSLLAVESPRFPLRVEGIPEAF